MTAPAIKHGKNARVYANGYKVSTYLTTFELQRSCETDENTAMEPTSDYRTMESDGIEDASISYEGHYKDASGELDEILEGILGDDAIVWNVMPWGEAAIGDKCYGLRTIENEYTSDASYDKHVACSGGAEAHGGAERCVILSPMATKTTSSQATAVNNAASSAYGGAAYLQCTGAASPTTLDVIVQGSTTGAFSGEETTVATFTQITSANHAERIAVTGTVPQYLRAKWTISGTSFTFGVYFSRASRT